MSSAAIQVRMFGCLRVAARGREVPLSPQPARLLAYLLLAPPEGRSRSVIASDLFAADCDSHARKRLSTVLWRLRHELQPARADVVRVGAADTIAIDDRSRLACDVQRFEAAVHPVLGKPLPACTGGDADILAEAVSDYRGDLLEGYYDDWVLRARDSYAWLHMSALTRLVAIHAERGNLAELERYARCALSIEPLREDVHRTLIAAYGRARRPDLARRQFEECRELLRRELAVEPMPETSAAHARACCDAAAEPQARRDAAGDPRAARGSLQEAISELEAARTEIARLDQRISASLARLRAAAADPRRGGQSAEAVLRRR